jgi:hypothetical protein
MGDNSVVPKIYTTQRQCWKTRFSGPSEGVACNHRKKNYEYYGVVNLVDPKIYTTQRQCWKTRFSGPSGGVACNDKKGTTTTTQS